MSGLPFLFLFFFSSDLFYYKWIDIFSDSMHELLVTIKEV